MGFFSRNRQVEGKFGTGLPIYAELEYQERNREIPAGSNIGLWQVPNNKLATTQFLVDAQITGFEIRLANTLESSEDGAVISIDVTQLQKTCLSSGDFVYTINDDERGFILDCGVYYYYFEVSGGARPPLYSERFRVGGVCEQVGFLTLDALGAPTPDIVADIGLGSIYPVVSPDVLQATVDATTYTADFQVTIAPDTTKLIELEVITAKCGTYTQQYRLQYDTIPSIQVTLTKVYP